MIVVGSGLAGLSAAFELASKRKKVLVLESNSHLGGRTASWTEEGMPVESGLHRYLGFYKELPELIKRAGMKLDDVVAWEDEIEIKLPDGPSAVFDLAPFFKPAATLSSIFNNSDFVSAKDKLQFGKMFVAGIKAVGSDPDEMDEQSVLDFAVKHDVSQSAIERLLWPLTAGTFFLPPDRYSAMQFFGLFRAAMPEVHRTRLGAFRGGMTEVMIEPIAAAIQSMGGEIKTDHRVSRIVRQEGYFQVMGTEDAELQAKSVVLATSLGPAQTILSASLPDSPWLQQILALKTMPACTIQFELKEPVLPKDRATFSPGTCLASYSEQSRTTFRNIPGRLSVILSPPEKFLRMGEDDLLEEVLRDADRLQLPVRDDMERYRVVAELDDFYSLEPGNQNLRPTQRTPIPGLVLAGDYTLQDYSATMEGAVISGRRAAQELLDANGK